VGFGENTQCLPKKTLTASSCILHLALFRPLEEERGGWLGSVLFSADGKKEDISTLDLFIKPAFGRRAD